ncbi:MAG TPA: hypothetical protein ENK82_06110 [Campylobacterales bacterium]|nr:hypothetical protein [Campylobacterales bacterium]HHS92903.1 hypothetical protein [Campylobacterales bacterium]
MKKGFLFMILGLLLMACTSHKTVLNPKCLELEKHLAELKNEQHSNATRLLSKISLANSVGMVSENSLEKEIEVTEAKLNECNR